MVTVDKYLIKKTLIRAWFAVLCLFASSAVYATEAPRTDAFDLAAYQGKVVYVDFWASWCTPCRASFPFMADLANRYGDDLAIVAINVDESRSDADAFLESFETPFDIVYDPDGELAKAFKVPGMPTSYLYDRNGVFLNRHIGFRKKDQDAIRDLIVSAL